jgi:hypothetical protein
LSWNLLQGVKMDCGCLLHSPEELSIWVVLRDTVFVVMGAFVLTRPKIPLTLD